jgi:hypothetical protein
MIRERALAAKLEMIAETLLWRGVIARTIQDWLPAIFSILYREAAYATLVNAKRLGNACLFTNKSEGYHFASSSRIFIREISDRGRLNDSTSETTNRDSVLGSVRRPYAS